MLLSAGALRKNQMVTIENLTTFKTHQLYRTLLFSRKYLNILDINGRILYFAQSTKWSSDKHIQVFPYGGKENAVLNIKYNKGDKLSDFCITDEFDKTIGYLKRQRGLSNSSARRFIKNENYEDLGEFTDIRVNQPASERSGLSFWSLKLHVFDKDNVVCAEIRRKSTVFSFFVDFECTITSENTIDKRLILASLINYSFYKTR